MSCSEIFIHVFRDLLCSSDYNKDQLNVDMLSKINSAFQVAADVVSIITRLKNID